jgi:riboflavin kinase / FMN adenylyltransferase
VQLEQELTGYSLKKDSLITIGVFDGVHVGHQYLIDQLKQQAKKQNLLSVVLTFSQHPEEILTPGSHPPFLSDASEKASLLKKEQVDAVVILTFTRELSQLSAREFVDLLRKRLKMRGLVIGPDFAMGKNNEGNIDNLQKLGQEMGFSVTVISPVKKNGDIVSSTAIRRSLASGDVEKVARMMGRPFSLHGRVIHGKGRGKGLGFPTVNLDILPGQALPSDGVYATRAFVDGKIYPSVTNVGTNPTFGANERTIEAFLLDYRDNLYEHEVKIDFVRKVRDEIKFDNVEDLKKQIASDITAARSILKSQDQVSITTFS